MRLRFTTADQVFQAFPTAGEDIEHVPLAMEPVAYLGLLQASKTPEDAIGFCAYLLSKLDAVWWACQAIREIQAPLSEEDDHLIGLAEAWYSEPGEVHRQQALTEGMAAVENGPAAWAALAAGWSGGSLLAEPNAPVPPANFLTAQAVRAAVLTAIALKPARERRAHLDQAIGLAQRMLEQA